MHKHRILGLCAIGLMVTGCPDQAGMIGGPIGSTFATATPVTMDASSRAKLIAMLTGDKVDVYDLGPMNPGDRINVTVRPTEGSFLDPLTAIFDGNEELFALNDDVDFTTGRLDSAIDDVVTAASPRYYLAITRFAFSDTDGQYQADVEIQRGVPLPQPPAQVILLDFDGGSVTIPGEGTINVDAFDAADIDAAYSGKTAMIKTTIINVFRDRFSATGLVVATTDDANLPADPFSIILFGGFSQTKFGIAEAVDGGNRDRCDDGIVFTDDFDKPFAQQPSAEGIGTAIGNVAAHEAGHLLGLNHVADVTDLMDTTGSASTLLAHQIFKTAELASSIFPFGKQNGVSILARVIPGP
jgi:hypothetical protein